MSSIYQNASICIMSQDVFRAKGEFSNNFVNDQPPSHNVTMWNVTNISYTFAKKKNTFLFCDGFIFQPMDFFGKKKSRFELACNKRYVHIKHN